MKKHIRISCPHCLRSGLKIRPEYLGRDVTCKHCKKTFISVDPEASHDPSRATPGPGLGVDDRSGEGLLPDAGTGGLPATVSIEGERLPAFVGNSRRQALPSDEVQHLKAALRAARRALRESRTDAEKYRTQLDVRGVDLEQARQRLDEMALENDQGRLVLARSTDDAARAAVESESWRMLAKEAEEVAESLRRDVETLSAELQSERTERRRSESESGSVLDDLRARVAEQTGRVAELGRELDLERSESARRAAEARELREVVHHAEDVERRARILGDELNALRRELDKSRAREAIDRAAQAALTESMSNLERRLVATLDELAIVTGRAESAEAQLASLSEPSHDGQESPIDTLRRMVEDLTAQIGEARQANRRLSSLLDVFGMPRTEAEVEAESSAETESGGTHQATDSTSLIA